MLLSVSPEPEEACVFQRALVSENMAILTSNYQDKLSKLRTWGGLSSSTASSVLIGIEGLVNLYGLTEEFLRSPLARQAISRLRGENCIEELLDEYVKLLDACNTMRDMITVTKQQTQDLHSTLRRRCAHKTVTRDIEAYFRSRRNLRKNVKKCLKSLNAMEEANNNSSCLVHGNDQSMVAVKMLQDVRSISVSVLSSTISFLSSKTEESKWSVFAKALMNRGRSSAVFDDAEELLCEFESVDASLLSLKKNLLNKDVIKVKMVKFAQRRLETLESCMEGLESGTDSIFRRLIQSRVSLLNILHM